MKIVKKIYCRVFQKIFKLAIPFLPYRTPEILYSVQDVPLLLAKRKHQRLLMVTDETIHRLGLADSLKQTLTQNGIVFFEYHEILPNPTVLQVESALTLYKNNQCTAIIGFGGGSAIDCAKAVGARVARPNKNLNKMRGILKILRRPPFTIAVPTTAGTGSETTVTTVITDTQTGNKQPISDLVLIPDACVLDAEITKTLPPSVTATTGMDALTHAIEAYIGGSTVKSTRQDALEAVSLISKHLLTAYQDGNNLSARSAMLMASHLAGRAFSKSYVGYCHAVAHSLGGKYGIPHGLANAVLLPYVLTAYGNTIGKKAKDLVLAMDITEPTVSEVEACRVLIDYIKEMNQTMDISTKLKGIKNEDIAELAAHADKEANPLYPVPVLMDAKALEQFYYDVMEA